MMETAEMGRWEKEWAVWLVWLAGNAMALGWMESLTGGALH